MKLGRILEGGSWIMCAAVLYFCGWKVELGFLFLSFVVLTFLFRKKFANAGIGGTPMIDAEAGLPAGASFKYITDMILAVITILLLR